MKGAPPVKVAVLGLTNPGIAIWDKAYVQGKLTFPGLEEQAAKWVPKLRSMGADVVVVSAHSGTSGTSSYGDQLPHVENAAANVARQVPGIDAILVGHAHAEIAELRVTNEKTGREVVLSEPLCYAERLTLFDVELAFERGRWQVESVKASLRDAAAVEDDPRITRLLGDEHAQVVAYVNQVVGTATETLTTVEARYKDAPIIDLISKVQEDVVREALAGTEHASLPVLSQASPFSRTSEIPAGDVTIRDLSSLYVYDNTLVAKLMTGAQVRAYLEYSAEYFNQTAVSAPVDVDKLTNAGGRPDYNYDYVSGVRYDIDIARPSRVADQEPDVRRRSGGRRTAVRVRGEQLPGQRRRGVPARGVGAGAVGGVDGDPHPDRGMGDGQGRAGPEGLRVGGLAADPGRHAGVLTVPHTGARRGAAGSVRRRPRAVSRAVSAPGLRPPGRAGRGPGRRGGR